MAEEQAQNPQQEFAIQRVYVKDVSFESPQSPAVFQEEWKPEMHLDIHTESNLVKEETHEVILTLTVSVKNADQTAFLAEVKQAGIFLVKGFADQNLHQTLGSFCPNVLYPYARQVITDLVAKGSFPQLVLAPINFDALYAQHLEQQKTKEGEGGDAGGEVAVNAS